MYKLIFKRLLDILLSLWALSLIWPAFLILGLWIYLDDQNSPVFYKQKRVGRNFKPFFLFKFRSMRPDDGTALQITVGEDSRITAPGRIIRATKLDELPQLFNILLGEMSIVGPRPEVEKYVNIYREEYAEVLSVRPGLSDFASIKYYNESEILGQQENGEAYYINEILPDKIKLGKKYVQEMSLFCDVKIILQTIFKSLR